MSTDAMHASECNAPSSDDPTNSRASLVREPRPRSSVVENAGEFEETLASAHSAMSEIEQEIDRLWQESIVEHNPKLSQRLLGVSRALRLAERLLSERGTIG